MKETPLVSIITPTYNHEQYIAECIESVLNQTISEWEMIIIDDGSTDKTSEIISKYSDRRIKYIKQDHMGPYNLGKTYNNALSICRGELIAILEGDDFWPKKKLENQITAFEDPEIVLSHGRAKLVYLDKIRNRNSKEIDSILNNNPIGSALYGLFGMGSAPVAVTLMIRKSTLIEIGGFKQYKKLPLVDFPTELELAIKGKFKFIKRNLGYFRRHDCSITHKNRDVMGNESIHYSEIFLRNKKVEIAELGIPTKTLNTLLEKNKSETFLTGIIQARELLNLKKYKESKPLFNETFKETKIPKIYKFVALVGLISSYLRFDLINLFIKPYSKFDAFYWKLKIR